MSKRHKFCIYLAGPITGCNQAQVRHWRKDVQNKYGKQCDFLDPVDHLLPDRAIPHEVVAADIRAIGNADGILVNMWRESIGTAMSVVHAHRTGRPLVVSDPNHLRNRALTFYADAVEDNPLKGMNTLLALLRAESWQVMTRSTTSGDAEDFRRSVLMASLENACQRAECDDIVMPRLAFPLIIDRLKKSHRRIRDRISTTEIKTAVEEVLQELEKDSRYAEMASAILREWARTQRVATPSPSTAVDAQPQARQVEVPVYSPRSHGTIWGDTVKNFNDIPSREAREIFRSIAASTTGITRIVLGPFARRNVKKSCQANIKASKTPFVIDGVLFDRGVKGTMQNFQVRVQFDDEKAQIAHTIEMRLRHVGRWAK